MKIFNFNDSQIMQTYFNEIKWLNRFKSELIIKYFDRFELPDSWNSFIITEYCQVSIQKSSNIY